MGIHNQRTAAMPTLLLLAMATAANAMTYKGCYSSSQPLVDQGAYNYQSSGHCQPICTGLQAPVLGFSGGTDCWCGSQLPAANTLVDDSKCDIPCTGYPDEKCGGAGYYTVWLTGIKNDVTNYGASTDASSSTTGSTTVVTSVNPGSTVVVTVSASATTGANNNSSGGGTSPAGVAAGVVVGVVAIAAIIGGLFFWLRRRKRQQAEEEYKRSAQVSDFMRGAAERKAPTTAYSQMSDSRLDPEAGRRNSVGSMADEHDYSRRILRVANPDH